MTGVRSSLPRGVLLTSAVQAGLVAGATLALACAAAAPSAAGGALVAGAAAATGVWRLSNARLQAGAFGRGALRLALSLLALAAAIGVLGASSWFDGDAGRWLNAALVAAGLAVAVAIAWGWPSHRERSFVLVVLVVGAALRMAYIYLVQVDAISDFGHMWRLASGAARGEPLPRPDAVVGLFPAGVYLERIVLYLLPVTRLSGGTDLGFRVANALSGVVSAVAVYWFARRWYDRLSARLALVLSILAVEPVLAATVPTHDIPGALLCVAVVMVGAAALSAPGSRPAWLIAPPLLGLLLAVLQMQRSIGSVAAVALLAGAALAVRTAPTRTQMFRIAVSVAVVAGVFASVLEVARRAGFAETTATRDRRSVLATAAATDSSSSVLWGRFEDNYPARYGMVRMNWADFAALKASSDTAYSPAARLGHLARKTRELFNLGSQTRFWLAGARVAGRPLTAEGRERLDAWTRIYWVLFGSLFVIGLWRLIVAREPYTLACLPLLMIGLLAGGLILLKEVQPRYLYFLWYLGAPCAGFGLAGLLRRWSASSKAVTGER